jgi:hypothetical protein
MRAVIIYESMFGNTHQIAEAIGDGLGSETEVQVVGVGQADDIQLESADLLVVGGPTQAWGMSRPSTRKGATNYLHKPGSDLVIENGAETGPGVREWLDSIGAIHMKAAAFDTRLKQPVALTGRASRGIAKALARHGCTMAQPPMSFLVDNRSNLLPGERERARQWGALLSTAIEHRTAPGV